MKIITRTRNLNLNQELENFIEEKIGSLQKFVSVLQKDEKRRTLAEVFLDIEKETRHHKKGKIFKAEAEIHLPGKRIMAIVRGDDLAGVITELKDKLQQEIKKYKGRIIALSDKKARKLKQKTRP